MSTSRIPQLAPTLFITAIVACANPKRVHEESITLMRNGQRVEPPARAMDAATAQALEATQQGRERRDSIAATALAQCEPSVCAALGRGEVALGMTEAQVLAATRTTDLAWTVRRSGRVTVLAPRDAEAGPRDAVGPVVLVQLTGSGVSSLTYREPQGLRTVSSDADVADAGRVRAEALIREGDALAAAGDFTAALERYDRASVVSRAKPELQYKMATSLDKLLRPIEASLRYQLFLHELELEKIYAVGNANAKLGEAIAHAHERIMVLDRRAR